MRDTTTTRARRTRPIPIRRRLRPMLCPPRTRPDTARAEAPAVTAALRRSAAHREQAPRAGRVAAGQAETTPAVLPVHRGSTRDRLPEKGARRSPMVDRGQPPCPLTVRARDPDAH